MLPQTLNDRLCRPWPCGSTTKGARRRMCSYYVDGTLAWRGSGRERSPGGLGDEDFSVRTEGARALGDGADGVRSYSKD